MKRPGIAINQQWTGLLTVLEPKRPEFCKLPINVRQLLLGVLTLGLVSCAPAKPPATPSPSIEANPIVTPTPSASPTASPSPKPSTRSSKDSSGLGAPAENLSEPEGSNDGGAAVEEAPAPKNKTIEAPVEKPQRTEKPAPAVEPEPPARVPQPSEMAPLPKAPKAPTAPGQSDDPEPPAP